MTKKDYIKIAECFKKYGSINNQSRLVNGLCKIFKNDNPLFDKDTFLKACGMDMDGE